VLEELYLLGRIARGLGTNNIDHRLRQRDFRDQDADPVFPSLGLRIAAVDSLDALLVIGANLRREVPILAHRVRKAARRGAKIAMLNPVRFEYLFPIAAYLESAPARQVADLAERAGLAPEHQVADRHAAGVHLHDERRQRAGRLPRLGPGRHADDLGHRPGHVRVGVE